ncbi:MAG: copper-binding protein [Caldimonas sp.]
MKLNPIMTIGMLAAASVTQAQMSQGMKMPAASPASATAASSTVLTDAEVQKVDAAAGVVTLKHGDIANMQMPAMTMAFGVADKKMLQSVKPGDKVKFHLEMVKGAPTVTRIEPVR